MSDASTRDAEIIAVGSEMLTSQRLDTNSLFITDQLNALGVEVRRKLVVGDDRGILADAVRHALTHVTVVRRDGDRLQKRTGCCMPVPGEMPATGCCETAP